MYTYTLSSSLTFIKFSHICSSSLPIKKLITSIVNAALSIPEKLRYSVSHPPLIYWKSYETLRAKYWLASNVKCEHYLGVHVYSLSYKKEPADRRV